jgi:hypothetical protein
MPDMETTLFFVSNQNGSTLSLSSIGNPTVDGLQYWKSGDSGWSNYTINTSFTLNAGDYIFFQNVNDYLSTSNSDYVYFKINGMVTALGSVMSLLNYSDTCNEFCFAYLFRHCTGLIAAPRLPATTLANKCYFSMFGNCSSLYEMPELPATTLATYCYQYMFSNCYNII